MNSSSIALCLCIILIITPAAYSEEQANNNTRDGCQIIVGVDMSSSVPWNTSADELFFAETNLCKIILHDLRRGDKVIMKPFGSFHNRTTINAALQTHEVRRRKANKSSIQKKVHSIIAGTKKKQSETSILGFLHNLPRLYPEIPVCKIVLLTDGFEYSEFGNPSDFAIGRKELPVRRPNYLNGVKLVFVGFGNTLDSHSSKLVTGLENSWIRHCKKAGAQCEFINW